MINIVTGNVDYQRRPFSLTFSASVNSIPVVVGLINDNMFEGSENFTLSIDSSKLPNYVMVAQPSEVVVVITDDNDGRCISYALYSHVFSTDVSSRVIIINMFCIYLYNLLIKYIQNNESYVIS